MDAASWRRVLTSIRPEDQGCLLLLLTGGQEFSLKCVEHLDEDVAVLRGRLGGQADGNRLMLMPYDTISSILVNRPIRQAEVGLYTPELSHEEKAEIARKVREQEEAERRDAEGGGAAASTKVDPKIREQLEALRELAGKAPAGVPLPNGNDGVAPASPARSAIGQLPGPRRPMPLPFRNNNGAGN